MSNFKFSVIFVFMVALESAVSTKVLRRRQNAVVSLVGSEDFYVQIKKNIPVTYVDDEQLGHLRHYDYSNESNIDYEKYKNLDPPLDQRISTVRGQSIDLKAKSIICSLIFDSPFFEAKGEVAVNYDLTQIETMNELRESKRDSYDDIYGNYPDAHGQWLNPYKQRIVLVGGERFEEHTFRCLARRRDSKTAAADSYVDYFVSPIYQSKRPRDLIMNGRFVFTSNENHELILVATAEERLSKLKGSSYVERVHQLYYQENENDFDGHLKPDDANNELCTLSLRDKIRLCDSVINLPDFPDKVTFLPNEANVKHECEELKVAGDAIEHYNTSSLRKIIKETKITIDITYNRWMVGCKVVGTGDDLPTTTSSSWYHISVGVFPHSVLIFKESATRKVYEGLTGVESVQWVEKESDAIPISYKMT